MLKKFLDGYEAVLHGIAEFTVNTLELIGILIIIIGSIMALAKYLTAIKNGNKTNIFIALGRTLAFALEFKMGAEIVNTVIIREIKELLVLAIVIALRAVLALLIHWEIKSEKREEKEAQNSESENSEK